MNVAIAGGTGFIGTALVRRLLERGDQVLVISRNPANVRDGRGIGWDAAEEIAAADAVINLAGENVGGGWWTAARKRRIMESRAHATTVLVDAIRRRPAPGRAFISASAVGYYGDRGGEILDETASAGDGFLAGVTRRWEELARNAGEAARVVILRFGVVLGVDGGALAKMLLPFRLGFGGPIGSGRQWMSWVDREDAVRAIEWVVDHHAARGVYNVTAPEPVTNREFTKALGRVLHRPAVIPVPGFALRAALGQMAEEMLLGGQRVIPGRATAEGFVFAYPTLEASLRHVLRR